jgi:hypothetical protein
VIAEGPYRVDWIPAFDAELAAADPAFLALFSEHVIPVLQYEPTKTTGPFTITYEPPYHTLDADPRHRRRTSSGPA